MSDTPPRILFVPVSGPKGMGEFARCRAIADALRARWPEVQAHFVVHREAPYVDTLRHPYDLLPASPTLSSPELLAVLRRFRPQVVVFDNAGRTDVLRAARAQGAHLVYISSRARQRYKAFRLRWMRLLDQHLIAYPAALAGEPTWFERQKLRLLGRPGLRYLDAIIAPPDRVAADGLLGNLGEPEVVIVPGGGTRFRSSAVQATDFAGWGGQLAEAGHRVALVAGTAFAASVAGRANLRVLRGVTGGPLMDLCQRARLVLVNGGDTLLQALVLGKACVAVPIAGDQLPRVTRCRELGIVAAPTPAEVVARCRELLEDPAARAALESRVRALGWHDALPGILATLGGYLGLAGAVAPPAPVSRGSS